MTSNDRQGRAQGRLKTAVLHRTRLQRDERDLSPVAGAEAISLLSRLSRESWSLSGLERPTYARHEIPCRFVPFPR